MYDYTQLHPADHQYDRKNNYEIKKKRKKHGVIMAYNSFNQRRNKGILSNLPDQRNDSLYSEILKPKSRKESGASNSKLLLEGLSAWKSKKSINIQNRGGKGSKNKVKYLGKNNSLLRMMEKRNKTFYEKTKNEELRKQENNGHQNNL